AGAGKSCSGAWASCRAISRKAAGTTSTWTRRPVSRSTPRRGSTRNRWPPSRATTTRWRSGPPSCRRSAARSTSARSPTWGSRSARSSSSTTCPPTPRPRGAARSSGWPHRAPSRMPSGLPSTRTRSSEAPVVIKSIGLLTRREGMTHEQFVKHGVDVHAPLAHAVPGIRRYVQSHLVEERRRPDIDALDVEIDGIAELWYDDREAMARALATPEAKALHADGALFIGRIKSYTIEEKVIIPRS